MMSGSTSAHQLFITPHVMRLLLARWPHLNLWRRTKPPRRPAEWNRLVRMMLPTRSAINRGIWCYRPLSTLSTTLSTLVRCTASLNSCFDFSYMHVKNSWKKNIVAVQPISSLELVSVCAVVTLRGLWGIHSHTWRLPFTLLIIILW